jgi:uncharacterized membrane protein
VALALSCKEDAALAVLVMGLLLVSHSWWRKQELPVSASARQERLVGLLTIGAAVGWWFLCTKLIIPWANDGVGPFYGNLFPGFGSGVIDIIGGILRNHRLLWEAATRDDCLTYYLHLFVPVAGLCLLSPVSLLGLPQLMVNVISAHGYTHDIRYHYSAIVSAAVLLGTVDTLGRMSKRKGGVVIGGIVLLGFALWSNREWSPSPMGKAFPTGIWVSPHDQHPAIRAALALVPAEASVAATYYIVPHLSQRQGIYEFPNPFVTSNWGVNGENPGNPDQVDFLVLDTTHNGDKADLFAGLTGPNGPFAIVFNKDGIVVARRSKP